VSYGSYRRKRDADARLVEVDNELAASGHVVPNAVRETPLATYATAWIEEARDDVRTGSLKERTARDRVDLYRRYIAPVFGARPVATIQREEVVAFRPDLIAKGLAPATVKGIVAALRNVLELAVEGRAITDNPAILRRSRKRNATATADGFEHRPLAEHQVAAVAANAADDDAVWGLVVLFLAYTGVRAAELAGLDVGDLRLTHHADGSVSGSVRIARTRKLVKREWRTDTPKSAKSTRRVPIADWLAEDLAAYLRDVHPYGDDPDAPLFPGRKHGGHTHGSNRRNPDAPVGRRSRLELSRRVEADRAVGVLPVGAEARADGGRAPGVGTGLQGRPAP
jgi:integrase